MVSRFLVDLIVTFVVSVVVTPAVFARTVTPTLQA